jgi:hypothetical protein
MRKSKTVRTTVRMSEGVTEEIARYLRICNRVNDDKVTMNNFVETSCILMLEIIREMTQGEEKVIEHVRAKSKDLVQYRGKTPKEIARMLSYGVMMGE